LRPAQGLYNCDRSAQRADPWGDQWARAGANPNKQLPKAIVHAFIAHGNLYFAYNLLMNDIQWKPKALKQLRKIDSRDSAAIRQGVNTELGDLQAARNFKALVNHTFGYRLRVGNYQVFFDLESGTTSIVHIEEVRKRDERTY
jgi:mRNA-degrading endonuclease RelE of RelBE toxin-antitoxin system